MTATVTHEDAARIRTAIAGRLGLHFDDSKLDELAAIFRARMAALKAPTADAYLRRLDAHELGALAERLTVGETYFFRYKEQFRAFVEIAAPAALREARRPIRVLSAGCATGEEPYTLAILACDLVGDVEIVACDVNPASLARAKKARYSAWSLRETPAAIRERCFTPDGDHYVLRADIRRLVRFEERNLVDPDPSFWAPGVFDVIFCRNVVMYFGADVMGAVVDRIEHSLREGGYLFMGHAETLRGISRAFHLCHTHETFYYQRKGAREAPSSVRDMVGLREWTRASPVGAPPVVPPALGTDTSWIEAIRQASERVAKLTAARPPAQGEPPAARADVEPVLDMMRSERFEDALALLRTFSPTDAETQLLRAILLTNAGRHAEAERACAELLARDDLNAGAHYLLALCREHAGDVDAAREHDRVAAYLDAAFAMPHVHMGLLERRDGQVERAQRELRVALELLASEDPSRILLFGGGFSRDALALLCRNELRRCGAVP